MISPEIQMEIIDLLEDNKSDQLRKKLTELHEADLADILTHINRKEERTQLFELIPKEKRGEVLVELDQPIQEQLLELLELTEKSSIIKDLDSDDAADILSTIDEEEHEQVLEQLDEDQKEEVLELLSYDEDSAGGLMQKEYLAVQESLTANEIIEELRKAKDELDDIYNVWVVDQRDHLLGRVRLKDLILADEKAVASQIMVERYHWVEVDAEQEEVARIFEKYDLVELPVVNEKHQLLGHITIDDIVDVIEDEAQEDISKLAGTRDEEIKEYSIFRIIKARLPWLIVALCAGFGAAFIMHIFDGVLSKFIRLAFFVPVVIGMSGNVGIQSSTIVIRGLATGEINMYDLSHRLLKELAVSLANGFFVSLILFACIFFFFQDNTLATVASISMMSSVLFAGMIGASIPFILKRLDLDPALSSGPFITTSNDIIGTLIYFLVAQSLLI